MREERQAVRRSLEQEETTREEKSGFHDVKIVGI